MLAKGPLSPRPIFDLRGLVVGDPDLPSVADPPNLSGESFKVALSAAPSVSKVAEACAAALPFLVGLVDFFERAFCDSRTTSGMKTGKSTLSKRTQSISNNYLALVWMMSRSSSIYRNNLKLATAFKIPFTYLLSISVLVWLVQDEPLERLDRIVKLHPVHVEQQHAILDRLVNVANLS